jgi:hypothetical protein
MRTREIITIIILIVVLLYTGVIAYKMVYKHNENLLIVTSKRIEEAAKKCVAESKCDKNNITLAILYEKGYLKEEYNPITKEIYSKNSKISFENNKYVFHEEY